MKIALLTHHFPPRFRAGGEQYAYRLAHGLHQRGFTVEVVTVESITEGQPYPTCRTDTHEGFPVHRLFYNLHDVPEPFVWSYRNPELGAWIKTYLEHTRPDLVHINSGYLLGGTVPEAAFALGLPTVLTLHDYWFICPQITLLQRNGRLCHEPVPPSACTYCVLSAKRRFRLPDQWASGRVTDAFVRLNQFELTAQLTGTAALQTQMLERRDYLRRVFAQFNLVLAPSQFLIQKMTQYGLTTQRLVHLPIGLENRNEQPVESVPHPSQALRMGYLGQVVPHKGVHLLVAAFQKLKEKGVNGQLIVYGEMSATNRYQRRLREATANDADIVYAGPYRNQDVGQVLSQLEVIVVPSVWYENYPVVILEALAQKKPVVAADLGGITELVTHEQNGLLFPVGDVAALAAQLQRLWDEPGLRERLSQGIGPMPKLEDELTTLIGHYRELVGAGGNWGELVGTQGNS